MVLDNPAITNGLRAIANGRKRPRGDSDVSTTDLSPDTTATASTPRRSTKNHGGSVSFASAPHEVLATVKPCSSMSESEKAEIWYPASDLDNFKDLARDAGKRMRVEELKGHATRNEDGEEEQSCHRGLEHRTSLERQRNKYVALRAVVECYRRLRSGVVTPQPHGVDPAVHLALVSSKVTRWAREVALSTGQSDFLEAYPMLRGVVQDAPTLEEISRAHPFPLALKRRTSFGGGQAGRVSPVAPVVTMGTTVVAGAATPRVVSPLSSPVLSPVGLPAVPITVEEDEDSDDEARRRMAKRQRTRHDAIVLAVQ